MVALAAAGLLLSTAVAFAAVATQPARPAAPVPRTVPTMHVLGGTITGHAAVRP